MTFYENLKNKFHDFWRYKIQKVPQIHLVVVGTPASGKSYQLYDIMRSFDCMQMPHRKLKVNGMVLKTPGQYETDVIMGGTLAQTPDYACRQDNFYGTVRRKGSKEVDIDFLNISGETFNDDGQVALYHNLYDRINTSDKIFRAVTWKRTAGGEEYVVEPLYGDIAQLDAARSSNEALLAGFRENNFLPWGQMFADLRTRGFHPTKKVKVISGEQLLKNLNKYNTDSVVNSIETIAATFSIAAFNNLGDTRKFLKKFIFLYHCKNATDMVICDKMLVPQGYNVRENIAFHNLCTSLQNFFNNVKDCKAKIYLAFRGADFLVQGREDKYTAIKNLVDADSEIEMKDNAQRNAQYSVFAYAMWKRLNPSITIDEENVKDYLGVQLEQEDLNDIVNRYLNLSGHTGKVADGGVLEHFITAHIGNPGGGTFVDLLPYSYPGLDIGTINYSIDNIVPHVYFTCTPITKEFLVYRNDPNNPKYQYARFITDMKQGDAQYFDTCGSNHCFGSYQLVLDILRQHGICIDFPKDLLHRCQATR